MITLFANTENQIVLHLRPTLENPYYLFVFSRYQGCEEVFEVVQSESDCEDYQLFNLEVDLNSGVYNLAVYEQEDYTNLNPALAEGLLYEDKVKVIEFCEGCDLFLATSKGEFIVTDEDEYIEITCE